MSAADKAERRAEYAAESYARNREYYSAWNKKQRVLFPERTLARSRVANALKHGRLVRPTSCQNCKEACKPIAHHWKGYTSAYHLDVQWLCRPCHAAAPEAPVEQFAPSDKTFKPLFHFQGEAVLIYLASPYSHPDRAVRHRRYLAVEDCLSSLFARKVVALSPIVLCHNMAERHSLPKDAAFWLDINTTFLLACQQVWVLDIPGWSQSKGVRIEVDLATKHNKPVRYVDVDGNMRYEPCSE